MRYLRLALVIIVALIVRNATSRAPHYDLSANYSTRLSDRGSVDRVSAQLESWERELRTHGFRSIKNAAAASIRSSSSGADVRTESREVMLVGKLEHLGHVQVRIRTDQDLGAEQQAAIDLQAQRKSEYAEAWVELGRTAQHLLLPQGR